MKRQWYYRGSLKSCNYHCSYCPFSKKKGSARELEEDREALFRFVTQWEENCAMQGALQIVPYGEALIHSYYWEALARLSRLSRVDAVGAQTNLSFPVESMIEHYLKCGGDIKKLRLWGTFHPQMTSMEAFLKQCEKLSKFSVAYCVGTVGVPSQREMIRNLRKELPEEIYLWINKMDGLGRRYTEEEIADFLETDPYFSMEQAHYPAEGMYCREHRFAEADGSMHRCNLCRETLGNLYECEGEQETVFGQMEDVSADTEKGGCRRKECSCYLAYSSRREEELVFFGPYPAFRIPKYPKAVFFDIDGTLIPKGEKKIPERYVRWIKHLSEHCSIYFATSLPYQVAQIRTRQIRPYVSGGVFANGSRIISGRQDEVAALPADWVEKALDMQEELGFRPYIYQKKHVIYKVTLCYKEAIEPKEQKTLIRTLSKRLGIPAECQFLIEGECVQITAKGTGKLAGILKMCEMCGWERDEIAFFGDSDNDVEAMEAIPCSVAAGGSSERAKKAASYVVGEP